jgi:hypothetical protein
MAQFFKHVLQFPRFDLPAHIVQFTKVTLHLRKKSCLKNVENTVFIATISKYICDKFSLFMKQILILLIVFSTVLPQGIWAQGLSSKNKIVKTGGATTVYQSVRMADGSITLGMARILNDNFYIQVTSTTFTDGAGKKYFLFYVPGSKITPNGDYSNTANITKKDWGRSFWIPEASLNNDCDDFTPLSKDKWSLNITTVPFKYRWSYKGGPTVFTGEATVGPSFSYRLSADNFGNNFNIMGGVGYTLLNSALLSDTANKNKSSTSAFTVHLGVSVCVKQVSISLLYGYDFTDDSYAYNKKPWISVGISGKLTTLSYYLNSQK